MPAPSIARCASSVASNKPTKVPATRKAPKLKVPPKSGLSTIAVVIGIQKPCGICCQRWKAIARARHTPQRNA